MLKPIVLVLTAALLLSESSASAHTDGSLSLSEASAGACGEGDTCVNTFDASWDRQRALGPLGGTLKVEATRGELSSQEFRARFAMVVSVPPKTREITFSSVWRLVGSATAIGNATAGCSVVHSQVGYVKVSTVFYATGLVNQEFAFSEKLTSSKPFPSEMTLWAELDCVARGSRVLAGVPSSGELVLRPDSPDEPGTALLHLHARFAE